MEFAIVKNESSNFGACLSHLSPLHRDMCVRASYTNPTTAYGRYKKGEQVGTRRVKPEPMYVISASDRGWWLVGWSGLLCYTDPSNFIIVLCRSLLLVALVVFLFFAFFFFLRKKEKKCSYFVQTEGKSC